MINNTVVTSCLPWIFVYQSHIGDHIWSDISRQHKRLPLSAGHGSAIVGERLIVHGGITGFRDQKGWESSCLVSHIDLNSSPLNFEFTDEGNSFNVQITPIKIIGKYTYDIIVLADQRFIASCKAVGQFRIRFIENLNIESLENSKEFLVSKDRKYRFIVRNAEHYTKELHVEYGNIYEGIK